MWSLMMYASERESDTERLKGYRGQTIHLNLFFLPVCKVLQHV
jgi:hypothetical protein